MDSFLLELGRNFAVVIVAVAVVMVAVEIVAVVGKMIVAAAAGSNLCCFEFEAASCDPLIDAAHLTARERGICLILCHPLNAGTLPVQMIKRTRN